MASQQQQILEMLDQNNAARTALLSRPMLIRQLKTAQPVPAGQPIEMRLGTNGLCTGLTVTMRGTFDTTFTNSITRPSFVPTPTSFIESVKFNDSGAYSRIESAIEMIELTNLLKKGVGWGGKDYVGSNWLSPSFAFPDSSNFQAFDGGRSAALATLLNGDVIPYAPNPNAEVAMMIVPYGARCYGVIHPIPGASQGKVVYSFYLPFAVDVDARDLRGIVDLRNQATAAYLTIRTRGLSEILSAPIMSDFAFPDRDRDATVASNLQWSVEIAQETFRAASEAEVPFLDKETIYEITTSHKTNILAGGQEIVFPVPNDRIVTTLAAFVYVNGFLGGLLTTPTDDMTGFPSNNVRQVVDRLRLRYGEVDLYDMNVEQQMIYQAGKTFLNAPNGAYFWIPTATLNTARAGDSSLYVNMSSTLQLTQGRHSYVLFGALSLTPREGYPTSTIIH